MKIRFKRALVSLVVMYFACSPMIGWSAAYRCYVEASDHKRYIVFSDTSTLSSAQNLASNKQIHAGSGKYVSVINVFECQPNGKPFLSALARGIEKITPQ